jgi:hypothetical protein
MKEKRIDKLTKYGSRLAREILKELFGEKEKKPKRKEVKHDDKKGDTGNH